MTSRGWFAAAALWATAITGGLVLAAGPPPPQGQRSVFSSRVEMVRIDALVTDKGRAVSNLDASQFEVTDNGVAQDVDLVSFDQIPLNIVIALDESSSLTGERLAQLRTAGASLAGILKTDDEAALLTFSETVTLRSPLTTRLDTVRSAIEATQASLGTRPTALVDAVCAAVMAAESGVGRALVVVFSDGVDTGSWLSPDDVVEISKRSDAVVYAVATHHGGRGPFLSELADATGGMLIDVDAGGDIGAAFLAVLNEFRQRYIVSYTPRGVSKDGWHAVTVRAKGRDLKVKARTGYWAGQ